MEDDVKKQVAEIRRVAKEEIVALRQENTKLREELAEYEPWRKIMVVCERCGHGRAWHVDDNSLKEGPCMCLINGDTHNGYCACEGFVEPSLSKVAAEERK